MAHKANWTRIKNDYINDKGSQRDLAAKYGVTARQIAIRSSREGWVKQREEQRLRTSAKLQQKTSEKIAERESEKAVSWIEETDKWMVLLSKQREKIDKILDAVNVEQVERTMYSDTQEGRKVIKDLSGIAKFEKAILSMQRCVQSFNVLVDSKELLTKDEDEGYEDDGLIDALASVDSLVDDMDMIRGEEDEEGNI